MDFFEHQDEARKKTKLLVFYYFLAVILIIAAVYAIVSIALMYVEADQETATAETFRFWRPIILLWTALGVVAVIGCGSLYKISSLSGGGKSVAQLMDGRLVDSDTKDPQERQLLNIVEEMAIASGIPVPPVYIIEQEGINAFAAGFNPSDAVIGVTSGCLEELNRDELQGVIAHEFSHILNGDMRLNIRLIGILFGILLIAVIGRIVMQVAFFSGSGRRRTTRSRGKGSGGAQLAIILLGASLFAVGAIGVFFGRLIKSAISRQREYLSDASAVQFTRNPDGIGHALRKIKNHSSRIRSAHAEEASHMFFAAALSSSFRGLLATHPPLDERIQRINPDLNKEETLEEQQRKARRRERAEQKKTQQSSPKTGTISGAGAADILTDPEKLIDRIGKLDIQGLAFAAAALEKVPTTLTEAARTPHGARAIVYCLLMSKEKNAFEKQKAYLQKNLDEPTRNVAVQLVRDVKDLPPESRMPLVEIAMRALQQQSKEEYLKFKETVEQLIAADQKVSIFEFALTQNLIRNLEPVFGKPEKTKVSYYGLKYLLPQCLPLIAMLAYYGNENDEAQAASDFAAGIKKLGADPASTSMPDIEKDPVKIFADSLNTLRRASGKVKQQIINACVAAILGNKNVTVEEAELLRAVADSLDCPMPPLTMQA